MNGATWWLQEPHSWMAKRQQELADSEMAAMIGAKDLVCSLSGGADSTAMYLHLVETGFIDEWQAAGGRVFRIFMDTGWEMNETYSYLDRLEQTIGQISRIATWVPGPNEEKPAGYAHLECVWKTPGKVMDADRWALARVFEARLGRYCPMIRLILQWGKVPTSVRKWCTADLKMRAAAGFMASLDAPLNAIGIRAEESRKRAAQPQWEWSDDFDSWTSRPIKWWSKADRIAIHSRFGLAPNPLYLQGQGAGRVGCRVCVNSGKDDLLWIEEFHPDTLGVLHDLDVVLASIPTKREEAGAGSPHWFTLMKNGKSTMVPIEEAIMWAHTERGGRTMSLFPRVKDPGCSAWGLCEIPEHL